jgi:hypothetical protein
MNKKIICISLLTGLIFSAGIKQSSAQVFDLSSSKKSPLVAKQDSPCVYKPSKLIIGMPNPFTVKAPPFSHVSLVTSNENAGYPEMFGNKLRLGQSINNYEGIVNDNGAIELNINLPNEKELIGKILYFEVLVWKNPDFSDLKVAKIMGIDGRETLVNAVLITEPPKKNLMPTFGQYIPGTDINMNRTMEAINKSADDNKSDYDYEEMMNYSNQPLMIRNLRAPEMQENNK